MNKNCFYNESEFTKLYDKNSSKRIKDFEKILEILKQDLKPKKSVHILSDKLKEYIKAYKPENQPLIRELLQKVVCVNFKQFHESLMNQLKKFSETFKEDYVLVIPNSLDIVNSSNFWVMLLSYQDMRKPIDIVFDLSNAITLHYPKIKNYVIMDDCIYNGTMDIEIHNANTIIQKNKEKKYPMWDRDVVKVHNVQDASCYLHIIAPYMGSSAYEYLCEESISLNIKLKFYFEYLVKQVSYVLNDLTITDLYEDIIRYYNLPTNLMLLLLPIIFQHDIANADRTISLILSDGQVLDNPELQIRFIEECTDKIKEVHFNSLTDANCPSLRPYAYFKKILEKTYGNWDDVENDQLIEIN